MKINVIYNQIVDTIDYIYIHIIHKKSEVKMNISLYYY